MNTPQKQRTEYLRGKGDSYAAIAADLSISENTIKSYCRRNNLGAGFVADQTLPGADTCANCGRLLEHTPGSKRKRFCSDTCRLAWWKSHPEAVNRKAVYNYVCLTCGTEFEAYGNARRRYCSRGCFGMARRASL